MFNLALTANPYASAPGSAAPPTQIKRVFPSDRCVPQLISGQASENPGQIALADGSMQLTYGELDDRAKHLAQHLKELGVAATTVVAVCMRRSPLAALASLAVMRAGAAYLPIDPNYPPERLSFILTDSRTPVVISDATVADKLPAGSWRLLLLDHDEVAAGN